MYRFLLFPSCPKEKHGAQLTAAKISFPGMTPEKYNLDKLDKQKLDKLGKNDAFLEL